MKVENESDRVEMPEECDHCSSRVKLKRYYHFGPGHNVTWLCHYCDKIVIVDNDTTTKAVAAMLNELEKTLKHFEYV